MKKILLTITSVLLITSITNAQDEDKSPTVQYLIKRGYTFPAADGATLPDSQKQWPDTVYYNTIYKPKLFRTPTIPISLSHVSYVNGAYQVEPTISAGFGYTWFLGDFIFQEDDKIIVDPTLYFGAITNFGLQSNFGFNKLSLNPTNFLGSIFAGGFIGFGSFSLFMGWDFAVHSPSIGLGGRIDLYTINQKYLKPLGKIRSARKHKKVVSPILNE